MNVELQSIANLPVFDIIYTRKESVNANAPLILESFLMRRMGLVGTEEIMNIKLQVYKIQINTFYVSFVNNGHVKKKTKREVPLV